VHVGCHYRPVIFSSIAIGPYRRPDERSIMNATPHETIDRMRALRSQGMTLQQITDELHIAYTTIQKWSDPNCTDYPLSGRPPRHTPPTQTREEDREQARRLRGVLGMRIKDIAAHFHVCPATVCLWCAGVDKPKPPPPPPKPQLPRGRPPKDKQGRFPESVKAKALELRKQGMTFEAISAQLGVTASAACQWHAKERIDADTTHTILELIQTGEDIGDVAEITGVAPKSIRRLLYEQPIIEGCRICGHEVTRIAGKTSQCEQCGTSFDAWAFKLRRSNPYAGYL
jgi:DNA-binding transcriptional regulator YiaG/predicted transcriptional regulator